MGASDYAETMYTSAKAMKELVDAAYHETLSDNWSDAATMYSLAEQMVKILHKDMLAVSLLAAKESAFSPDTVAAMERLGQGETRESSSSLSNTYL
jgi:hypothetical protein